jgi:dTDP-4-dehydrorhamnose reductase
MVSGARPGRRPGAAPAGGWLVTGAGGMLGQDVLSRITADGRQGLGLDHGVLDITDRAAVRSALAEHRPAVVVNCAAWTAVDDAEEHEEHALLINGEGPGNLAEECHRYGSVLLQVSTDYVFAGDATSPYPEGAPTNPRSAYGRTKRAGERAVLGTLPKSGFVVRTGWLYGAGGRNFVRTMIELERTSETVDVVDDQRGQPTWTMDLADRLVQLGQAALAGAAPRRDLPRHQQRRDHLVRLRPGGLRAARRRSRTRPAHHRYRLHTPRPPPCIQRPRPRPLRRGVG